MLSSLKFRRVQPSQAHVGSSFANSLEFVWTVGSNEKLVWDDSYLSVTLRCRYSDASAFAAIPAGVGLSNSPMSCLFTDASMRINNREVSRLSEYSQGAMIHQLLTQSAQKNDNNGSANPISLERRWAVEGGVSQVAAIQRVKHSVGLVSDGEGGATAGEQKFTISGRLPIMLTKSELDGNTAYIVRLVVDPQWRARLSRSSGALAVADLLAAAAASPTFHLDVSEMTLNLRMYETDEVPRSVVSKYESTEIFSTTRAILASAGAQRYTFTMPRSVSAIFFTFYDSRQATGPYSPTRFISEATTMLESYEMRYAGTLVPSPKHDLALADTTADRKENNDAFRGFIQETMDLSPNGSQYSAVEWASQPVFYHQVVKPSGSEAFEATLELNFAAAPSNSILYFAAFSPRMVELSYNDTGVVSEVSVSDIIA